MRPADKTDLIGFLALEGQPAETKKKGPAFFCRLFFVWPPTVKTEPLLQELNSTSTEDSRLR